MNKYWTLMVLIAFMLIITMAANSIEMSASANVAESVPESFSFTLSGIVGVIGTFWRLLTFQVVGVPVLINLVFVPVTFGVIYMLIDIAKDLVPLT